LAEKGLVKPLFERFGQQLAEQGYRPQKGQILDVSIIPVAKERKHKAEKEQIKFGEMSGTPP
jgi:transposase, IS5 family